MPRSFLLLVQNAERKKIRRKNKEGNSSMALPVRGGTADSFSRGTIPGAQNRSVTSREERRFLEVKNSRNGAEREENEDLLFLWRFHGETPTASGVSFGSQPGAPQRARNLGQQETEQRWPHTGQVWVTQVVGQESAHLVTTWAPPQNCGVAQQGSAHGGQQQGTRHGAGSVVGQAVTPWQQGSWQVVIPWQQGSWYMVVQVVTPWQQGSWQVVEQVVSPWQQGSWYMVVQVVSPWQQGSWQVVIPWQQGSWYVVTP
ncbi:hypothetical protein DV515_00016235 [Chloebia gouldiae]|uniref:Uncharacterized protein n=1 Tax=Chloebia gouldiae TaxID=44316 RepID=A0A3L8RSW2_CHLGU|nr:hypothetical protein DV515_00016235 [Chloebia gouldiae]